MTETALSNKSIYRNIDKSVAEGLKILAESPSLSFEFSVNAEGGLRMGGRHALRGQKVINAMDNELGGGSPSSMDEAFSGLLAGAKAAYRSIIEQRRDENCYITVIGPVYKR